MKRIKIATVITAYNDAGDVIEIVEIARGKHWTTPRRCKKHLMRWPFEAGRVTRHNVFELRPSR